MESGSKIAATVHVPYMNSSRLWGRKRVTKKKKKGENVETETQRSKRQPKHTLNVSLNASFHCPQIIDCPKYPTATVHFHMYSYPEGITSIFYLAELKVTIVLAELEFLDNNHFL